MKLIIPNRSKIFIISSLLFVMMISVLAVSGKINTGREAFVSVVETKDDDIDKNMTNVKVMYNPIAEQINVNFKLSKQSTVVIKLMDALGNEVLGLSNGTLEEGLQSLSFDTNGKVSAGFYFVKLSSGTETVIKRVSVR